MRKAKGDKEKMAETNKPEETGFERLFTPEQVKRHFRVDGTTLNRWARAGAIESVVLPKLGKVIRRRYKESEIKRIDPHFGE